MRVIILGGKARVGKTTLAKGLAEKAFEIGFRPIILPFAKPLKEAAAEAGFTKEENPEEYREFCQRVGTEKRDEDPDHWVKAWTVMVNDEILKETDRLADSVNDGLPFYETVLICDDCRYPNEVEQARFFDAYTIFLRHNERVLEDADAPWRDHISEQMAEKIEANPDEYHGFDIIIHNDNEVDDLLAVGKMLVCQFFSIDEETPIGTT